MSLFNNTDPESDELTPEEKELLARIEGSQSTGAGAGTAAGTALGALAGGLLAAPTGVGVPAGIGLGASLGGSAGGMIGSWLGGMNAEDAEKQYEALRKKKTAGLEEKQRRGSIAASLINPWLNVKGL